MRLVLRFGNQRAMRSYVKSLVESTKFQRTILFLIVVNAILLGMETSKNVMQAAGDLITSLDAIILYIFVIEMVLKLYAYGLNFFRSPWNVFDLSIVSIAFVPMSESFAAMRALRVLRVLRVISTVPTMRRVIEGLLASIPGIVSVLCLMFLFFYVFAVIGTHLYGEAFPEWFGTLGETTFTLFQIMTLEGWAMEIVRPMMDEFPSSWIFFSIYILVASFTMLNLFIAIIVNAMDKINAEDAEESREIIKIEIIKEMRAMEKRLKKELQK